MRKTKKRVKIKKHVILRLLEQHGGRVPIAVAAREMYGSENELAKIKVARAICGYRSWAREFSSVRIRNNNITYVNT